MEFEVDNSNLHWDIFIEEEKINGEHQQRSNGCEKERNKQNDQSEVQMQKKVDGRKGNSGRKSLTLTQHLDSLLKNNVFRNWLKKESRINNETGEDEMYLYCE